MTAYGPDWHAIGCGVRDKRGAAIVTISEVNMGNIALADAMRPPREITPGPTEISAGPWPNRD